MLDAQKIDLPRTAPDGKAFADDAPPSTMQDGKVDPGPLPQVRDHAAPVEVQPAPPAPQPEPPPDNDLWKMPLVPAELLEALAEVGGDRAVGQLGVDPDEDDDLEILLAWNRKDAGQFPVYPSGQWHGAVDLGLAKDKPDDESIADRIEVRALAKGTVIARVTGNYVPAKHQEPCSDNHLVIRHPLGDAEVYALYLHLGEMAVEKGQEVSSHQVLGKIGQHGPFPHLHLAVISLTKLGGRILEPEGNFDSLGAYPEAQHIRRVKVPSLGRHWPAELRAMKGWYAYHPLYFVAWARGDGDLPELPAIGTRQRIELTSKIGYVPILPGRKAKIQVQAFLYSVHLPKVELLTRMSYDPDCEPLGPGAPKEAVQAIGKILADMGYDTGPLDGNYNERFKAAVKAFQTDARPLLSIRYPAFSGSIEATGLVDWPTLICLDRAHTMWGRAPAAPVEPQSTPRPPAHAPKTGAEKWALLCKVIAGHKVVYGPGKGQFVPRMGWRLTEGGEAWPVPEGKERGMSFFPDALANFFLGMYTNRNEDFDPTLALQGPRAILEAYKDAFELKLGGSFEPSETPWRRYGDPATGEHTPVELFEMKDKLEGQHILLYRTYDRRDAFLGVLSASPGKLETIMLFGAGPKSNDGSYTALPAVVLELDEEELGSIEGEMLFTVFSLKPLREGGLAPKPYDDNWSYPMADAVPEVEESEAADVPVKKKDEVPEKLDKSPDATQPELDPGTTLEETPDGTVTAKVETPDGPIETTSLADGTRVQEQIGPDGEKKLEMKDEHGVELKSLQLPDGTSQSGFVEEHRPDGSGRLIEKKPDGTVTVEEHSADGKVKTTLQEPGKEPVVVEEREAKEEEKVDLLEQAAAAADKAKEKADEPAKEDEKKDDKEAPAAEKDGAQGPGLLDQAAAAAAQAGATGAPAGAAGAADQAGVAADAAQADAQQADTAPPAEAGKKDEATAEKGDEKDKDENEKDKDDDDDLIKIGTHLKPPRRDRNEKKYFKRMEQTEVDELEPGDILLRKRFKGSHPLRIKQREFEDAPLGSNCTIGVALVVGDGEIVELSDQTGFAEVRRLRDTNYVSYRPTDGEAASTAVEVARWLVAEEVEYTDKRGLDPDKSNDYGDGAEDRHDDVLERELPDDDMMGSELVAYCFQGQDIAYMELDPRYTPPIRFEDYLHQNPRKFRFNGALRRGKIDTGDDDPDDDDIDNDDDDDDDDDETVGGTSTSSSSGETTEEGEENKLAGFEKVVGQVREVAGAPGVSDVVQGAVMPGLKAAAGPAGGLVEGAANIVPDLIDPATDIAKKLL